MMTFRKGFGDFKLPLSTVWLMSDIAEAKGRQELYTKQGSHCEMAKEGNNSEIG